MSLRVCTVPTWNTQEKVNPRAPILYGENPTIFKTDAYAMRAFPDLPRLSDPKRRALRSLQTSLSPEFSGLVENSKERESKSIWGGYTSPLPPMMNEEASQEESFKQMSLFDEEGRHKELLKDPKLFGEVLSKIRAMKKPRNSTCCSLPLFPDLGRKVDKEEKDWVWRQYVHPESPNPEVVKKELREFSEKFRSENTLQKSQVKKAAFTNRVKRPTFKSDSEVGRPPGL